MKSKLRVFVCVGNISIPHTGLVWFGRQMRTQAREPTGNIRIRGLRKLNITTTTNNQKNKQHIKRMQRTVSLTNPEVTVVKALLFDPKSTEENVLTPSMILQCPGKEQLRNQQLLSRRRKSYRRRSKVKKKESNANEPAEPLKQASLHKKEPTGKRSSIHTADNASLSSSENEVRGDSDSESFSWETDDVENGQYDTWEVLNDEYAPEFGLDFTSRSLDNTSDLADSFQILGTSLLEARNRPHVLSPPMMDALLRFVPESLSADNFWLRYSAARDGFSLATLQQYVRAAQHTVLAIETTEGRVFGSFTSSSWRRHYGLFGSLPIFVWKMRHNSRTKCASLYDQAQLESEIDVYFPTDTEEQNLQLCRHDLIGVGGGGDSGFAFMLEEYLDRGTSQLSGALHSPCLAESETFRIANVEVWSFTPCETVETAEQLELRQFALVERNDDALSRSTEEFYKRVGHDVESQARRDRWQYLNMMNGDSTSKIGSSPNIPW